MYHQSAFLSSKICLFRFIYKVLRLSVTVSIGGQVKLVNGRHFSSLLCAAATLSPQKFIPCLPHSCQKITSYFISPQKIMSSYFFVPTKNFTSPAPKFFRQISLRPTDFSPPFPKNNIIFFFCHYENRLRPFIQNNFFGLLF